MEWLLYNDERQEFLFVDEWFLQGLRSTFEDPTDDPEYVDEFDELERHGWRKATPLTVAMALGDVHDEESLATWRRGEPDQAALIARLERVADRFEAGPMPATPPEALPPKEAAAFMGIELGTLEYLIRSRKIAYVQVGDQRRRVVRVVDMRKFMEEHTVITAEEALKKRGRLRDSRSP